MKAFIKHNSIYIFIYIILLCYVGTVLLNIDKVSIHKNMNAYVGNTYIDAFFAYATHLGDGLLAFIVAIALSFKNVRGAIYILLSYISAGIVSSILKHWVYYEVFRPHFVFQYFVREELKLVDGVDVVAHHSFPSGHALSAFALFFCLLFITKNHFLKFCFFMLAILAGYSRVHLSQHWLIDVYVGSIIGLCFSILMYIVFYANDKWPQLNTSIFQLLKNRNKGV